MKPLILILLLALSAEAQSLADAARRERERQAQVRSTRMITNDDIQVLEITAAPSQPADAAPAVPAQVTSAQPQITPVDPAEKYREDLERVRARVRELQDLEVALQLQVNQLTNQLFAPVTDQGTRDQAQMRIGEVQSRLTLLRGELGQSQRTLADMVAQGPPRE
jgi:hypothetical protein